MFIQIYMIIWINGSNLSTYIIYSSLWGNHEEQIVDIVNAKGEEYGLSYEEYDWLASSCVPADHFLIKTLKEVYEEETGFDAIPQASGGATYARAIDNCVTFGMVFPESTKTEHQPDEYITMKDLVKATEIYALTLYKLAI